MANLDNVTTSIQRPAQVRLTISLLYAYAVISLLIDLTLSILNRSFSINSFIVQVIVFLVSIFLVLTISKGKTWPRNLLLVFSLLATCFLVYSLPSVKAEFRYQFILVAIKYAVGFILIATLYLKPAKQWFETLK